MERPRCRPGLDNEIERFAERRSRLCGIDLVGEILRSAADHHPRHQPPAAHDVEHGELFRDSQRRVVQRQGVAYDDDLRTFRSLDKGGRDQVRRRHQAIGVLMVLIDADAVETQVIGMGKGVYVLLIEVVAL